MKDPQIAYKERLENILNLIKDGQYSNCFNIAQNLTNFAWTVELEDEVFISEVLEAIFTEMSTLTSEYEIPDNIAQELQKNLSTKMENLIKAYPNKDPRQLYICLKELRYVATYNQLHTWQKYPKKKSVQFQRVVR